MGGVANLGLDCTPFNGLWCGGEFSCPPAGLFRRGPSVGSATHLEVGQDPRLAHCVSSLQPNSIAMSLDDESNVKYLLENNIPQLTNELIEALVSKKPAQPSTFLHAILQDKCESGTQPQPSVKVMPAGGAKPMCARMQKLMKARETWESGRAAFYAWLDQTPEEALEPGLEIVDPHHHIWDMRELGGHNLWGILKQQYYMADELLDDFVGGGHRVSQTVFVTTHAFNSADLDPVMAPLGEVQAVQGVAAQFASGKYGPIRAAAAIISSADLTTFGAEVEPLLLACKAASPNYRGIRCTAAYDPNLSDNFARGPGMYLEPKFREGFALLEKHGLVFDAWLFSCQLPDLLDLAKAFPRTTIVLNHNGSPVAGLGDDAGPEAYKGKQEDLLAKWKADMSRIAEECPNVYVKVGGNGLPQLGHGFDKRAKPPTSEEVAEAFKETYLWTIQTFGAARCMFEGNFPVDKVSMSYTVLWNAYKRMTKEAGLSEADRA